VAHPTATATLATTLHAASAAAVATLTTTLHFAAAAATLHAAAAATTAATREDIRWQGEHRQRNTEGKPQENSRHGTDPWCRRLFEN
jgi:hypothetical protein